MERSSRSEPAKDWYAEISTAMNAASVAVFLISADFLGSDFILKDEVTRLIERRDGGRPAHRPDSICVAVTGEQLTGLPECRCGPEVIGRSLAIEASEPTMSSPRSSRRSGYSWRRRKPKDPSLVQPQG